MRSFHCKITGAMIMIQSIVVIRGPMPRGQSSAAAPKAISCSGSVQYEPSMSWTPGSNEAAKVRLPHRSRGVGRIQLPGAKSTTTV